MRYIPLLAIMTIALQSFGQTTQPKFQMTAADYDRMSKNAADYESMVTPTVDKLTVLVSRFGSLNYSEFHEKLNALRDEYALVQQRAESSPDASILNDPLKQSIDSFGEVDEVWSHMNNCAIVSLSLSDGAAKDALAQASIDQKKLMTIMASVAKQQAELPIAMKQEWDEHHKAK